jgi:tryptophanyl-tRNA synthetase
MQPFSSVVGWLPGLAACLTLPPDLHAITVPQDPQTLRNNIKGIAVLLIACGIDKDRSILFQ